MTTDIITRRAEFILNEARHTHKRDQCTTYALRVLSNYATIGRDAPASTIKGFNRLMSRRAYDLLHYVVDQKKWTSLTINEHSVPLNVTWKWICDNCDTLTASDIIQEFSTNPMVTITREEDGLLRENGYQSKGTMNERYNDCGIEIISIDENPKDISKRLAAMNERSIEYV